MQILGLVFTVSFYLSMLVFVGNYAAKVLMWMKTAPQQRVRTPFWQTARAMVRAGWDILLFRRLMIVNDVLWVGEWVFHGAFVLVILRHLRYFLNPVPHWVVILQTPGIIAGFFLPAALAWIFTRKILIEKKKYVSSYNFLLLALIFLLGITGILMKTVYHPDIFSVKAFAMGIVTFNFEPLPGSALFIFHFVLVLLLILNLPTHIFAAPLTILGAREREEELKKVTHEE